MKKISPTIYYHKPPMKSKDFEIYYNKDINLKQVDSHSHTYYELLFLISGKVRYTVDSGTYELKPGDSLLISPGLKHHAKILNKSEAYERYVLWLRPEYIESLSSPFTNLLIPFERINYLGCHVHLPPEILLAVTNLLQMALIQSNSQEYGADLLINAYITEILIVLSKLKLYQQPVYFKKEFDNNDIIINTLNYIVEHIHEDIQISDITDALFISRAHLSRIFSEYMGISIHQFIMKKKMYLIRQEIHSGFSIENICTAYGFGTYSSFYRAFKKEFGMSPRALLHEIKSM